MCDWKGWLDESRLSYPSVSLISQVPPVSGEDVDIPSIMLEDDRYPYVQRPVLHPSAEESREAIDHDSDTEHGRANGKRTAKKRASQVKEPKESVESAAGDNGTSAAQEAPATIPPSADAIDKHNGFDAIAEMSPTESVPMSTKVNPRFHHESRHKAVGCPGCGEYSLFRSRSKGLGEFIRKKFTNKRPYRCQKCGWRGWVIKGL